HDVVARRRQPLQHLVAFENLGESVSGREHARLSEMRDQMHRVCGEHDETALGFHSDALQAHGVAADVVQRNAWRYFAYAFVEGDATGEHLAEHRNYIAFFV